jgi:riboflavin transporter FmnP
MKVNKLTRIGVLSGIALILMIFIRFPLFPAAPYLTYDPSDTASLIAAFWLGAPAGVLVALIKNALFLLLVGDGGPLGVLMNFIGAATFALTAGLIYRHKASLLRLGVALAVAGLAFTLVMIPANMVILPLFFKTSLNNELITAIITITTPFNIVKAIISGALTFFIYMQLRRRFEEKAH